MLYKTNTNQLKAKVENADKYVVVAILLHNYLRMTNNAYYRPTGFIDSETNYGRIAPGAWRKVLDDGGTSALRDLTNFRGSRYQTCAFTQRDNFQSFFMNRGAVEWQVSHLTVSDLL